MANFNENTIILNFANESSVPTFVEKRQRDREQMVPFGEDNRFPQDVQDLIDTTSLVDSIIDKSTKYIYGQGIDSNIKDLICNDKLSTFSDIVYRAISDYVSHGAFALQIRRNQLGEIKKIDNLDITRIRTNEENTKFWYSKEWTKFSKSDIVYDRFNGSADQNDSIFYFKSPYEKHVYGKAAWMSSLNDVVTLKSISEFNIATVNNAFAPSAIVSLCEGKPDQKQAQEVEKEINKKFSGAKNASKVLVTFSDSKDSAPVITLLAPNDLTQQYIELQKTAIKNIFSAFRMDPLLAGIRIDDGLFSQDSYEQIYALYNETEVKPVQQLIQRAFAFLDERFAFKFIPFEVKFKTKEQNNIVEQ